jgi:hypothetical protein
MLCSTAITGAVMPIFKVTIAPEAGLDIFSETIEAPDFHQASFRVLEKFKQDSRVSDATSWTVKIAKVNDA